MVNATLTQRVISHHKCYSNKTHCNTFESILIGYFHLPAQPLWLKAAIAQNPLSCVSPANKNSLDCPGSRKGAVTLFSQTEESVSVWIRFGSSETLHFRLRSMRPRPTS